ncbi:MAG: alpha/beta hydrolase [Thermodesulfobacteriota bacterium]
MLPLPPPNHFARKTRRMAFETMFRQLAGLADFNPVISKAKRETERLTDLPYRSDGLAAHTLDVYRPRNRPGPFPILIYIHGGGFTLGSKETHRACGFLYARMGYLVFNINYRLAPKHPFPAAVEDACNAFCWVVTRAASYGGDIHRLTLAGESAGGNLVMAVTVAACFRRPEGYARRVWDTGVKPAAVQTLCGLLQVSNPERFHQVSQGKSGILGKLSTGIARDVAAAYLGRQYRRHIPDYAMADPLVLIEASPIPDRPFPPIFVAVGTADLVCSDSERLVRALASTPATVEARYYPDEPHAFHFLPFRPAARSLWRDSKAFLDRHAPG